MQESNKSEATALNDVGDMSLEQGIDAIGKTISAISKLNEQRKAQEALSLSQSLNSTYTKEELETLAYYFNQDKSFFTPLDDRGGALSLDKLTDLVNKGNYGALSDFTSECAQAVMTPKQFLTAAMAALCDDESFFTYDVSEDVLYCNVVGCTQRVALKKGENLFALKTTNIKATPDKDKSEITGAFAIVHAYLLYLSMINKLHCEDEVTKLFSQKDTYKEFFAEVIKTLSQIFVLGINNINFDVSEKVKALYVQSSSYRIEFLKKSLNKLYSMLQSSLENRAKTNLNGIFELICRIINTVEAMDYQNDRDKLINLYSLNEGHEFVLSKIPVLGCGYAVYDFSNLVNTNKSYRYFFYDFISQRFLVIRTIVTDYFSSPNTLFDGNYQGLSLKEAANRHLTFQDVFVIDNKVTNSQHSSFIDHLSDDKIKVAGENKTVLKFDPDDYRPKLNKLYDIFAFKDFNLLKEKVYATSGQYFVPENRTESIHLVKVSKLLEVNASHNELKNVKLADSMGNELTVYLQHNNTNSKSLIEDYKDAPNKLENFYMLVQCPIVSGLIRPMLVSYFTLESNSKKKKKKK